MKKTKLFLMVLVLLTVSTLFLLMPKRSNAVTLPSSINLTEMAPTKAQKSGTLTVLDKADVEGAENDVLWYNNSNLTTDDHAYRWSYLHLRKAVEGGQEYSFSIRLKVFKGEENISKPPTLNCVWFQFFTMSSIVYNAAVNNAFVQFMNDEEQYGAKVNKLGDAVNYFAPNKASDVQNVING